MPEYSAPGVRVEETSYRAKSIEGADTTIAGFIGPTRCGPVGGKPGLLTSLGEFERVYGDGAQLVFRDPESASAANLPPMHNFMWHAARAFFQQGGKRLFVVRVFKGASGDHGLRPGATEYEGTVAGDVRTGLKALEEIEDIAIVAAPGSTFGYDGDSYGAEARTIVNLLIDHAERMRYRIAVLDSGDNQTVQQVREMRARINSTRAALYYPWVTILDPITGREINLPPSGFLCGIYARNDIQRGVFRAPANEVISLAVGLERLIDKGEQEVLNPEGINCLRFLAGRGFRVWGARTAGSDPEWKYVHVRRYIAYLERSIVTGTQWAVFEPNSEALWINLRRTIEDFLMNEWRMGALMGEKPERAFFVTCDRTTMTQDDIDNGRLVCLVGVALLRPAEFVIFRIGQWTADRR